MFRKLSWLITTVALVAGCAASPTPAPGNALTLTPPWKGDEHFEYNWVSSQDNSIVGTSTFDIKLAADVTTLDEQDKIGTVTQHTVVKVDPQTLKPLSGQREVSGSPSDYTLTSTYQDGKLSITAKTAQGDKNASIDVPTDAIDNDSLLMVLRGAPLAEGYSASFTVIVSANALQVQSTAVVSATESVTVPAGTFQTYKVDFNFSGTQQTAWYEVAAPHRLIQYANGATRLELVKETLP
jgi:hypothetical protein